MSIQTRRLPSLKDLNETSEWVGHECRVSARHAGWLIKCIGVESLFDRRKGALEIITREFSGEHLVLRSLPDMALRSQRGTYLVEAKAADSQTANVAVELFQLLLLREFVSLGAGIWYCFGRPDEQGRLVAWMMPSSAIDPFRIDIPARVNREWPAGLPDSLIAMARREFPDAPIREVEWTAGSNDPYALISKSLIEEHLKLGEWIKAYGPGFGEAEKQIRIAWEGHKDAKQRWSHILRHERRDRQRD